MLVALVTAASLAGCALPPSAHCGDGDPEVAVHTLYFGRNRPGGVVSPREWQGFVDLQVTPRFIDGLTHWDARGQWRNPATAQIEREESFVLQLVVPGQDDARQRITDIMAAYKAGFQQQSILHVRSTGCANL
jgi:hypothetical protein